MDTLEISGGKRPAESTRGLEDELVILAYDAVGDDGWPRFLEALGRAFPDEPLTLVVRDGGETYFASSRDPGAGLSSMNPASVFGEGSLSRKGFLVAHAMRTDAPATRGELIETWSELKERSRADEPSSVVELFGRAADLRSDRSRELLRRLLPHFHGAVRLSLRVAHERARNDGLVEVLEGLHLGVIVLGAESDVRYRNPAATRLLRRTESLALRGSRLEARPARMHAELSRRVRGAALAGRSRPRTASRCLVFGEDESAVLLWIRPLRSGLALAALTGPNRRRTESADALQHALGLSPREADVASLFAQSRSCEEIGARLSMRPATARLHLKHVLAKTDTHRQVELLRRIVDCLPEIALMG